MTANAHEFRAAAERAVELIPGGSVVGLGTGHAAAAFVHVLGERVRAGLRVRGVPTSEGSADLARQLGIPLVALDEVEAIDVDVDGADEVDPHCDLIKGLGGALVREKIVAAAARQVVILVGPEKLVPVLGTHGVLPVEVVPFGLALCRRRLADLGCGPELRMHAGAPFVSDNGNSILDCRIGPLDRPAELDSALRAIPGVVGTGLFLGMADTVLIQRDGGVEARQRRGPGGTP
jgi:ribose 5-phosphate isomerase A